MTGADRVRLALQGEFAPDGRVPYTVWYPIRHAARSGGRFVRVILELAETYEPDLLKVPQVRGERDDSRRIVDLARIVRLSEQMYGPAVVATVGEDDTADFARAAVEEAGCAGIFLLLGEGSADDDMPRGAALLKAAGAGWCNVAHLHTEAPDWESDAPVLAAANAVSWATGSTPVPTLDILRERVGRNRCLIGGVDERRIAGRTPDEVRAEVAEAIRLTDGGRGMIVGPNCSVPAETPPANLYVIREAVRPPGTK